MVLFTCEYTCPININKKNKVTLLEAQNTRHHPLEIDDGKTITQRTDEFATYLKYV